MSRSVTEHESIRALLARSGRLLDAGDYPGFIDLFHTDATYTLEADSPEIGKTMRWLDLGRDELAQLLAEGPQHVHDLAERTHMVTTDAIAVGTDETATAVSTFAVFRTSGMGVTSVYAVGSYHDRLSRSGGGWLIASRRVLVKTRMFQTPTPLPL